MMIADNISSAMMGVFGVFFLVILTVIIVLWIALPFSVFGTKNILREILREQKETNRLIKKIIDSKEVLNKEVENE